MDSVFQAIFSSRVKVRRFSRHTPAATIASRNRVMEPRQKAVEVEESTRAKRFRHAKKVTRDVLVKLVGGEETQEPNAAATEGEEDKKVIPTTKRILAPTGIALQYGRRQKIILKLMPIRAIIYGGPPERLSVSMGWLDFGPAKTGVVEYEELHINALENTKVSYTIYGDVVLIDFSTGLELTSMIESTVVATAKIYIATFKVIAAIQLLAKNPTMFIERTQGVLKIWKKNKENVRALQNVDDVETAEVLKNLCRGDTVKHSPSLDEKSG